MWTNYEQESANVTHFLICQLSNFKAPVKNLGACNNVTSWCFWSVLILASLNSHFFHFTKCAFFSGQLFSSKCERKMRFLENCLSLLLNDLSQSCLFKLDFCFSYSQGIWKTKSAKRFFKKRFPQNKCKKLRT